MAQKSKLKSKVLKKPAIKTYTCLKCSEVKTEKEYYKNGNTILPYCKKCIVSMCLTPSGLFGYDETVKCLKLVNKPIFYKQWVKINNQEISPITKVSKYFQFLSTPSKQHLDWSHSQDENFVDVVETASDSVDVNGGDRSNDLEKIKRWNTSSKKKIKWLEEAYEKWVNGSPMGIQGVAQKNIVEQMCQDEWRFAQLRKEGKPIPSKEMETYLKMMGDANLKPVQETTNTFSQIPFGVLIEMVEKSEPIKPLENEDFYDKIHVWIVGQLAKMHNMSNEITNEYNNIIKEYSVEEIEKQFENSNEEDIEDDIKDNNNDMEDE